MKKIKRLHIYDMVPLAPYLVRFDILISAHSKEQAHQIALKVLRKEYGKDINPTHFKMCIIPLRRNKVILFIDGDDL